MPDRGDLVAYPAQRIVRRDGAYTWHRADLSEAHALAAIADGSMRVTTPSGETLDFVYERHEEHPSGDWTWVGRLERGNASDEVVLTFGDKAAFGTIAQPGREPLRLTIRDGASWLIETDASRIADIRNRATQPKGPDYLVPPSSVASRETAALAPSMASAPSMVAATSTTSSPIVDLVLGYTPGFAAMYGGQSQAVTRLNNMVAITNEAYANSQITGRVRLVHTLQVNYADNTDNGDALEKLTGYRSGTGWITPDPAFNALRAARDQYGGDLVSLVRKFNDPENDGCGIAWMIGGGGSTVDTGDAPFGYSVVSDGQDTGTDGKTYFCRHETLAHEIGHNLGSQHDKATATKDGKVSQGAYTYSFGYKTTSTGGNFYTVMAYGDSGQTRYRVFSNPRTTFCGGYACGVAEQADNARSLVQTFPVIASFRASVYVEPSPLPSRARFDVDTDTRSDMLWHNPVSGELYYWLMDGHLVRGGRGGAFAGRGYTVRAVADFNGDGRADVLWSDTSQLWLFRGAASGAFESLYVGTHSAGWQIAGAGDVNADGKADLLWHNPASGELYYWLMDGHLVRGGRGGAFAGRGYTVRAVADFNGDGRADVLWSDNNQLWLFRGGASGAFESLYVGAHSAGWQVAGAGDVNADGKADLFWHNATSGELYYWLMDGHLVRGGRGGAFAGRGYTVRAIADFNGDGRADVLWSDNNQLWLFQSDVYGNFEGLLIGQYPVGWLSTMPTAG